MTRWLPAACVRAALLITACGDPPNKEMDQAQGAIDAARAAGADRYAATEYTAATDALKRSQDAVAQRDYRLALNEALNSREHAQNAAREGADTQSAAPRRGRARHGADRGAHCRSQHPPGRRDPGTRPAAGAGRSTPGAGGC